MNRKNGSFRLRNLPPGRYTVRIWAPGFNTNDSNLIADPFEVVNQDIKSLVLQPRVELKPKPKPKPKKVKR